MTEDPRSDVSRHADRLIESRVERAAEKALLRKKYVSAIDVLLGLGWLMPAHLDMWRQGRVPFLERVVHANLKTISAAMKEFHAWARRRGMKPSETVYVARTPDRRRLRFSESGSPEIERCYRTHYVSPELSERKREKLNEKLGRAPDLVVIDPLRDWACESCGGGERFLIMDGDRPLCLKCAKLDHLVYLPAGDAALTRRAKSLSGLAAVVVRFSRARERYERQGVLVEAKALEQAKAEILEDGTSGAS